MSKVTSHFLHRHLLHHYPFFPLDSSSLPPSSPPQPSTQQSNYPFTTSSSNPYPFFPSNPPPPPTVTSFPANIPSHIFPNSSHHQHLHYNKLLTNLIATSLSTLFVFLLSLLLLMYQRSRRRNVVVSHKPLRSENSEHAPSLTTTTTTTTTTTSDGSVKMNRPPPLRRGRGVIGTSTEFLYLGTAPTNSSSEISSPELRPLPPLPKFNPFTSGEQNITPRSRKTDEEFFSPRGSSSSSNMNFADRNRSVIFKTASLPSSNPTSSTLSVSDCTPTFVLLSPSLSSSSPEIDLGPGRPLVPPTRSLRDGIVNLPPPSFSNSYTEAQHTQKLNMKPSKPWPGMTSSQLRSCSNP